jgi:hypothetical protein
MLALTPEGHAALEAYRRQMQAVLEGLPPAPGSDRQQTGDETPG